MPTFSNVQVTTEVEVDFEVFCGTCGAGLCSESEGRLSRHRGYAQVVVNACPACMEKKDEEIEDLKSQLAELEEQLELSQTV